MTRPRHLRMTERDRKRKVDRQRIRRLAPNATPQSWKKIGMTMPQYMDLYRVQGGKCGICSKEFPPWSPGVGRNAAVLHVDHCHRTGKVRGASLLQLQSQVGLCREVPQSDCGVSTW